MIDLLIIKEETHAFIRKLKVIGWWIDCIVFSGSIDTSRFHWKTCNLQIATQGKLEITQRPAKNRFFEPISLNAGVFTIEWIGFVKVDEQANIGIKVDTLIEQLNKISSIFFGPRGDLRGQQSGKRSILITNVAAHSKRPPIRRRASEDRKAIALFHGSYIEGSLAISHLLTIAYVGMTKVCVCVIPAFHEIQNLFLLPIPYITRRRCHNSTAPSGS